MGYYKNLAIELEESGDMPDPTSELKKNYSKRRKGKKAAEHLPEPKDDGVPMSINRPFDNAYEWLMDEPWRTW